MTDSDSCIRLSWEANAGIAEHPIRLRALNGYYRLLEKSGRVPSEPRQWRTERDIAGTVEVIIGVFERHAVPVEAQREICDMLDGRGRAREAG